ncbi:ABC transporter ATP-binding protein [Niveispirillum cyanobacteriorum]|nr:ABC transporter ATP-binding protein [Niveispirillum cyanobacteriorum]GGE77781.1 peptide ABC transporter ATP-binding protein [Niveispirillum cyanobacteriorum]
MQTHVEVRGLCVAAGAHTIVADVDFSIPRGSVLALIGESGSGKTTIAMALMGYARLGCRIAGGSVRVSDTDVLSLDEDGLAALRGDRVSYIAQSAAASFNPSRRIMDQVVEPALIHGRMDRKEAETKAVALFRSLALPDPDSIGERYPHQLSGGQLQRLMAAMALITGPELVILDEPTTALDVTTQIEVLRAFKQAVRDQGATAVYVSHDLAVVAQMADAIVVLNKGRIRENGSAVQVLQQPEDEYTRTLMAAARPERAAVEAPKGATAPLLEIKGLNAGYGATPILRDINLTIARGATLGVIGESGSGKSTLARVIAGLLPPSSGSINFDGARLPPALSMRNKEQFRRIQLVFQNADTALNPAHSVGDIIGRPLAFYHGLKGPAAARRVAELLDLIKLPASLADRPCGGLSGGQKQRINLARALAAKPDLIMCDEVTSALDTVVGAAILDLLAELKRELGLAYLFISHDIATVRAIADDIMVLYAGTQVETGGRQGYEGVARHPYTDLLIGSVPELRPGWLEEQGARPAPPAIGQPKDGADLCRFLPRCSWRVGGTCEEFTPPRHRTPGGNIILCHRPEGAAEGAS